MQEARHLKELVSARVTGIVIVPTSAPKGETLALLRNAPHVQLSRRIASSKSTWFGIDDEDCLRTGTAHLIDLGHRRIAASAFSLRMRCSVRLWIPWAFIFHSWNHFHFVLNGCPGWCMTPVSDWQEEAVF
jgi:DNA-binding LacI/PurR family transcriptional regulator